MAKYNGLLLAPGMTISKTPAGADAGCEKTKPGTTASGSVNSTAFPFRLTIASTLGSSSSKLLPAEGSKSHVAYDGGVEGV
jgi:hypothetical protein